MRDTDSLQIPARLGTVAGPLWQLDSAMAAQAGAAGAQYVSGLNEFCNQQGCRTIGSGSDATHPDLLFRDRDHLTVSGSRMLLGAAAPVIFADWSAAR